MPTLHQAPEIVLGFDVSKDTLTIVEARSSSSSSKPCVIDNTAVAIRRFLKSLKRVDLAVCEPTGGHEHVLLVELMAAGIIPVITHPERLAWVEDHYDLFVRLARRGAWMQVTAGALTGRFGRGVKYWGERFVDEGHCMLLATDAHHPQRRPPLLAEAREAVAARLGTEEALHMVLTRPAGIVSDLPPQALPPALHAQAPDTAPPAPPTRPGPLARLLQRAGRRT